MQYSNDETDKQQRKKDYYLKVYVFPVGAGILCCIAVYLINLHLRTPLKDKYYGYVLAICAANFLWLYQRKNWLKMPDNSWHNIAADIKPFTAINNKEPLEYDASYYNSTKENISNGIVGVVLLIMGIVIIPTKKFVYLPIILIALGFSLAYKTFKELVDKLPVLKLDKKGLWTRKLGFINWDKIERTEITEIKNSKAAKYVLNIYLKDTAFAKANQPDELLNITNIKGNQFIETVLENYQFQREGTRI